MKKIPLHVRQALPPALTCRAVFRGCRRASARLRPRAIFACAFSLFIAQAQTLPAKLEFDAASIKPSPERQPGQGITVGCNGGPGTKDPGLFRCQNMSMSNLVTRAYETDYYRVAGLESTRDMFDISARVPAGTTKEQFALMLQSLLAHRFHLAVHHESREITKYELVIAKSGPKFSKAAEAQPDPDAPPAKPGDSGPMKADKDGFPILKGSTSMAMMNGRARLYQPRMTMQRLASQISGQMRSPVTDATGLDGEYEIGLYCVSEGSLSARTPEATDPADSGPTLPQALQEQLGLRLEQKKGPVDFVVVDHLDRVPVGN